MPQSWEALPPRIFEKFTEEPNTGCWLWHGRLDEQTGYSTMLSAPGLKTARAYRIIYQLLRGPVAPDLDLDHLCRVRCCVNPDHLEPVSHRENMLRGDTFARRNAEKTHCRVGHPFDEQNTHVTSEGHRRCLRCWADWAANKRRAKKSLPYETVPCACGCGGGVRRFDGDGRERRWLRGHDKRLGKFCRAGHELTPENSRVTGGCRSCRICERERERAKAGRTATLRCSACSAEGHNKRTCALRRGGAL